MPSASRGLSFLPLHVKAWKPLMVNYPQHCHSIASPIFSSSRFSDEENLPDKDWFTNGREVAQKLKMELGICDNGGDGGATGSSGPIEVVGEKTEMSSTILESGRAAARELLRDIEKEPSGDTGKSYDNQLPSVIQSNDATSNASESGSVDPESFDFPCRKSHCMTVCMVPPSNEDTAWERLTSARECCRDPGFYRWPPHANLLYPFLEPVISHKQNDISQDEIRRVNHSEFMLKVTSHLSRAAQKCPPFDVTIDSLGTFGGTKRGVLWAYPKSECSIPTYDEQSQGEPLIHLQSQLERAFPACKDQKRSGIFNPHITLSHYPNQTDALTAKSKLELDWKEFSFRVSEIYLLHRMGDDGQFKIAATIPLGLDSVAQIHDPPIPFPNMPASEEDWVRAERMKLKARRNRNSRKKRSRGEATNS